MSGSPSDSVSPSVTLSSSQSSSISGSPSASPSEEFSKSNTKTISPSISIILSLSISQSNTGSSSLSSSISASKSSSISLSVSTSISSKTSSTILVIEPPIPISEIITLSSSTTKSSTPNPSISKSCTSCFEEIIYNNENPNNSDYIDENDSILIENSNGNIVGSVSNIFNENENNQNLEVIIKIIDSPSIIPPRGTSDVVDISVFDENGNPITKFNNNIEICLQSSIYDDDSDKNKECLSYFDESKQEWICEDRCLKSKSNNMQCGDTDHLTNFALLLDTGGGNGDPCDSDDNKIPVLFWVSIGCIIFSILFIMFSMVLIQIRYYIRNKQLENEFEMIDKSSRKLSKAWKTKNFLIMQNTK